MRSAGIGETVAPPIAVAVVFVVMFVAAAFAAAAEVGTAAAAVGTAVAVEQEIFRLAVEEEVVVPAILVVQVLLMV
jgi:hypothetical protein